MGPHENQKRGGGGRGGSVPSPINQIMWETVDVSTCNSASGAGHRERKTPRCVSVFEHRSKQITRRPSTTELYGLFPQKQGWAPGPVFPGTRRTRMPDPGPRTTRVRQGSPGLPETRVPGWPSTKNALDEAEREKKRKGKEEKERMSE